MTISNGSKQTPVVDEDKFVVEWTALKNEDDDENSAIDFRAVKMKKGRIISIWSTRCTMRVFYSTKNTKQTSNSLPMSVARS